MIFGIFLILAATGWYLWKQDLIITGQAQDKFPYRRYTQEELNRLYPQYPNADVATRQTPEETYTKFIAALKNNDLEEIMKNFKSKKYQEYRTSFGLDIDNHEMDKNTKLFNRKLILRNKLNTFSSYYLEGIDKKYFIEFVKDADGVWKIDSL